VQILEYSGEELEDVARERFMPVIARTGPDFRGRSAVQELGEALTLSRSQFRGQISAIRTDRMAARALADNLMLYPVHLAGRVRQHDREPDQRGCGRPAATRHSERRSAHAPHAGRTAPEDA
jgi:hypothetical protein